MKIINPILKGLASKPSQLYSILQVSTITVQIMGDNLHQEAALSSTIESRMIWYVALTIVGNKVAAGTYICEGILLKCSSLNNHNVISDNSSLLGKC